VTCKLCLQEWDTTNWIICLVNLLYPNLVNTICKSRL